MVTLGLEWILAMLVPIAIIGYLLFIWHVMTIRKYAPEAEAYAKAYKKNLPLITINDKSGTELLAVGVKEKKGDISFDSKRVEPFGLYLDPSIQGIAPTTRTMLGTQHYHFSTDLSFALGSKNARALLGVVEYTRKEYPELDFLDDLELISLLGTPHNNLTHDAQNYIDRYEPEVISANPGTTTDMKLEELVGFIEDIQSETSTLPVRSGFFSYAEAFKLIPTAMLPQDINQLIMWVYRKARKDIKWDAERLMMYAMAVVMVLAGVGVTIYILSIVKPG